MSALRKFIRESNLIEGIDREPLTHEVEAMRIFLSFASITLEDLHRVQAAFAPAKPIRDCAGMNVKVGDYRPPAGGPLIVGLLTELLVDVNEQVEPWHAHLRFEQLHPYLDGNGRAGRALWAWSMLNTGQNPFALPFLHRFYYQTLREVRL